MPLNNASHALRRLLGPAVRQYESRRTPTSISARGSIDQKANRELINREKGTVRAPALGTTLASRNRDLFEVSRGVNVDREKQLGGGFQGTANAQAGVTAYGRASGQIGTGGASGRVEIGATAGASARAGVARDWKHASVDAEVKARAGAEAHGVAEANIGKTGATVSVNGEAFVGVKVNATARGSIAGGLARGEAGVEGMAGVGVTGSADASFSAKKIGFKLKAGASLGLGGSFTIGASVDPSKLLDQAGDMVDGVKKLGDWLS